MISWKQRTTWFLGSQGISLFGSTLVQMAVIWHVTMQTQSGVWVSAFTICGYLPQFLCSVPGGIWADRCQRKVLILWSDGFTAFFTLLGFFLLPLMPSEEIQLILLLFLSALRSCGAGVQGPAVNAALSQLVPAEALLRCNGINAALQALVQFAAPAAAGVLLSFLPLRSALLVDVITAAVGMGILIFIPLRLPGQTERKLPLHIFLNGQLRKLILLYAIFVFLCVPGGFLSGLLVSRRYGNHYGLLSAAELAGFAGMTAGGLLIGVWGERREQRSLLIAGLSLFGAMSAAMGIVRSFPVYLVMMVIYGIAMTAIQTTFTTLVQACSDDAVRGQACGLMGAAYAGALPLGMLFFGPLADRVSLSFLMILAGAALITLAVVIRRSRATSCTSDK